MTTTYTTLTHEEFFNGVGDILEPILDWYQSYESKPLEEILANIVEDLQQSRNEIFRLKDQLNHIKIILDDKGDEKCRGVDK